jgi:hypothetical protein
MGGESFSPLDAADFFAEYYGVPRRHSRAMLQRLRGESGAGPGVGLPEGQLEGWHLSSALLRVVTGVEELHVGEERHGSLEWLNLFVHAAQRLYPDLDPIPATVSFLLHCCGSGVPAAPDPALANLLREPIRRSWVQGGRREQLLKRDAELDPHLEGVQFGAAAFGSGCASAPAATPAAKTIQAGEPPTPGHEAAAEGSTNGGPPSETGSSEREEAAEGQSEEVDDSGGAEERKGGEAADADLLV